MKTEEADALIASLEKRLKTAEQQCQATTREIWQMEVELSSWEERAKAAEARISELESAPPADTQWEERARAAEAQLPELEERAHAAESRLEELEDRARADAAEVESRRSEIDKHKSRLWDAESQLNELRETLQLSRRELASAREVVGDREREIERLQSQQVSSTNAEDRDLISKLSLLKDKLEQQLLKAEERASLAAEDAELLQKKLQRQVDRLEIAEERNTLLQQRVESADGRIAEADNKTREAERQLATLQDRLQRLEARAQDADRIDQAAETKLREAEAASKESWQRVRDAETRANQATVEQKKLADKLAELERRSQESDRETQRLAFQDPLTGLPNLNLIGQYLDFTVKQCVRYRRVAALLIIDLDRFKVFNEAMGFKAGDELLVQVAERLKTAVRETDSLGRKGEDEFLILLSELNVGDNFPNPDARYQAIVKHVEVVANRVMQSLAAPFTVQGQKFFIQSSIGIAICPDNGDTPQSLVENGDTAMYHVKETGRNRFQFYNTELRKAQEKRLTLDTQMRLALERNEFIVHYLPVVSLTKGRAVVVGAEALIRWNHRVEGLVGPDYFLPAAEESGMIIPIGHWVIQQTCRQLHEWLTQGFRIFASVNLSKRQLLQADLVETISREIQLNHIPPEAIYVEIAEGFNTFNPDLMDQVVNKLGQAGLRIAIDDFGVGYSSLSRLNLNYTRVLKIDRTIIEGCPNDKQSSTVCIASINLASSLGLLSLAEGVENAAQVKFLTKYGCSLAQGHYFAEPMPPLDVLMLHKNKKVWKI